MAIKYDLYQIPSQTGEEEKARLHARVVTKDTVSTEKLAKQIEYSSSLTESDVRAVVSSLSNRILAALAQGSRVHIEGLGYFQLGITCTDQINKKEARAHMVKFKTIHFLPEKSVKEKFRNVKFERSTLKIHSRNNSLQEIEEILKAYFTQHDFISRASFQDICGLTKSTALNRINQLIEKGKLTKVGIHRFPLYRWVEEKAE